MDPIKILKRAWQILWSYRALWIFGIILALAGAGGLWPRGNGGGGRDRSEYQFHYDLSQREDFSEMFRDMSRWFQSEIRPFHFQQEEIQSLIWTGVVLLVGLIILGIVLAILRYVAETALIRMVDEYEGAETKHSIREGFRIGWSRTSWRLFLINLLVKLPMFVLLLVILLVGAGIFLLVSQGNQVLTVTGIIALIGMLFLFIFLVVIASVILNLLQHFFWRACALEQVGVRESLRRGFKVVKENWKDVGIMWLVMIGLGIVMVIGSIVAFVVLIPVFLLTAILGILLGAIPTLLVAGITSLYLSGFLPWVAGVIAGLPLFLLVTFSPMIFLRGLVSTYYSTVWTLTYRELGGSENGSEPLELAEIEETSA